MNIGMRYWLEQTGAWGASREHCAEVYQTLLNAYCSKSRHYHDLTHIEQMLEMASEVGCQIEDKPAFYFAIWFHDAVQKVGRDSEALSAEFAAKQLSKLHVPEDFVIRVQELILATKHGKQLTLSGDSALLVDIDLSILGSKPELYSQYANNCRKEYKIPNTIYRSGRRSVLKGFLSQTHIFYTEVFRNRFEQQARINLQWELSL